VEKLETTKMNIRRGHGFIAKNAALAGKTLMDVKWSLKSIKKTSIGRGFPLSSTDG
jgi:hypothetical protein